MLLLLDQIVSIFDELDQLSVAIRNALDPLLPLRTGAQSPSAAQPNP